MDFEVIPSNYDEHLDDNRAVSEVAKELALGKANEVAVRYPDAYVIGSVCQRLSGQTTINVGLVNVLFGIRGFDADSVGVIIIYVCPGSSAD